MSSLISFINCGRKNGAKVICIVFILFALLFGESFLPQRFQFTARLAVSAISLYQYAVSGNLRRMGIRICKYEPTCSEYTKQSIIRHGTLKGSLLGVWRIGRCNPCSRGGYDPVK